MRRLSIAVAATATGVVIIVVVVLLYAAANLNSIIAGRREAILAKASAAIGRPVKADNIKAKLGWGVSADISGVTIGDDPAVSSKPFVQTGDVYARLELLPLLGKRIEVTEIVLEKPVVRIVETRGGRWNVSALGAKRESAPPAIKPPHAGKGNASPMAAAEKVNPHRGSAALNSLFIKNFTIDDGTVIFKQQGAGRGATVNAIDLHLKNFGFHKPFTVDLAAAAFGPDKNISANATIGPLLKGGALDVDAIPVSAKLSLGPLALEQLRAIPQLAAAIPAQLSMPDPVSLALSADGTAGSLSVKVSGDLTSDRIAFGDSFNKPAGVALKFSAAAVRAGGTIGIKSARVTLADLKLKAADVKLGGGGLAAHLNTNNFDLAPAAKLVPALAKYGLAGNAMFDGVVRKAGGAPSATGTLTLSGVGLALPGRNAPRLGNLGGKIQLNGATADSGPLTFNLGATKATLKAHADSIWPAKLNYDLSVPGAIHLADFVPSRPSTDEIGQLTASGTVAAGQIGGPSVDVKLASPSGNLNRVPYENLSLAASIQGNHARLMKLNADAFSGNLAATGGAGLAAGSPFTASVSFTNIDLQSALESQDSKAAKTVRGALGGNINLAGKIGSFDAMNPTLQGDGQLTLTNGKLVGINVGGDALRKVQHLPLIGNLVPKAAIRRHPELFDNPDTDIQTASLTFTIAGPKIVTHDLKVRTIDYSLLGDGWVDMDKSIGVAAQIVLARQFSGELIAAKHNIRYLADRNGQIIVPLQISGQLPKPEIVPDVAQLAQRAGRNAVENQGQKFLGKFLGKKGLGGIFGGGNNSAPDNGNGASSGNGSNPPSNPLNQLKKLF
ncbi:MAG: AsmA family protein [Candidatus Binataceae bacterium]